MLDNDYIEEIRALDNKDAKSALADYGKTFGIDLKKTKSFDNMLTDLQDELQKIADEPMPDDNDGMSISDLIDDKSDEDTPEEQLLLDEIGKTEIHIGNEKLDHEIPDELQAKAAEQGLVFVKTDGDLSDNTLQDVVKQIIADEELPKEDTNKFKLPEDYGPRISLMGRAPGFMVLPWWIYQWVAETPDWKDRPTDFPHPTAHDTLFTLIYYINRDGSVIVRETKNSKFVTLN